MNIPELSAIFDGWRAMNYRRNRQVWDALSGGMQPAPEWVDRIERITIRELKTIPFDTIVFTHEFPHIPDKGGVRAIIVVHPETLMKTHDALLALGVVFDVEHFALPEVAT